jgi:hypothetical protein
MTPTASGNSCMMIADYREAHEEHLIEDLASNNASEIGRAHV